MKSSAASVAPPSQILVIDDDSTHAHSVRELLASHGYRVETAADGETGLARLNAGSIDVLLLDLNMPDVSGLDVLGQLNGSASRPKTIVLSGETDVDQVAPVLRLGAYDYLKKPYDPEQLLSSVKNAVERCELEREHDALVRARDVENRRHAFLVNAAPDLIYLLDADGRVTYHNDHLRDVFGFAGETAVGLHWRDVIPRPLHGSLDYRVNERRSGERATRLLEVQLPTPDGANRSLELSAVGVYTPGAKAETAAFAGTYGVVRDVTHARRISHALAQSQEKFRALFHAGPEALFISRLRDGRIIESNDNFLRIMGRTSSDPIEHDVMVWGTEVERAAFVRQLEKSPERYVEQFVRTDGRKSRTLEVTARLLELDSEVCIVASLHDLTQQRQAEQDRLNLETQLQQSSKMEAIGQLAGGIAHDFNNILASIIGYTELALVAPPKSDPAQVRNYLSEVVSAGQRARDLISQMLTFTRAHRGNAVATDVRVAIGEVSRMLRAAIPKTIDIRSDFADVATVRIDPVQLQQVVINLLVNARDAISGNGRIDLRVRQIEASGRCAACDGEIAGEHVALAVSDTGHGIEQELLPRVFEMFVSTRDPGRGTGMGLWLVNTIVHEYGGHIVVQTSPRGTTFDVYLPCGESPPDAAEVTPEPVAPAAGVGHIVVIDDEVSVGNFIGEALRNAGYEAFVFNDASAAIDHLTRRVDDVSLVLTDFSMPQLTGLDVAEAAGALDRRIPVVIVTGFADKTDKTRMARLGVSRLLTKPFRIEALLGVVRELTRTSQIQ